MTLKDISPCDCSIIPMSPKEVRRVIGKPEAPLKGAMHKATRMRKHQYDKPVLCPGCGTVWEYSEIL